MIKLIVAMTKDFVIGNNGKLPWHLPDDMKLFKQLTSGHTVLMGRKTYESIPSKFRPLPNRHNIVVSRSMPDEPGITVCRSPEKALVKARDFGTDIFIIGGSAIYDAVLPHVDMLYISWVRGTYEGDTTFPEITWQDWDIVGREDHDTFEFVTYQRR